ncbi:MAG: flagellar export chaperone FliS [Helicobacter sp.]|nr:flagellar export chaperone FliS [Helicobacter sp.]
MNPYQSVANNYSQNVARIESSERAIALLYEGSLRFLGELDRAILKIKSGDTAQIEVKTKLINRLSEIFTELLNMLDYDNGKEAAHYLSGLYTHQLKLLAQINLDLDETKVAIIVKVVRGLLEAWKDVHDL